MSFNVFAEPLLELVVGVKEGGHDEMEQGPELGHGVLYGGTGEKKTAAALELEQHFPALAAGRLDRLGFIQNLDKIKK